MKNKDLGSKDKFILFNAESILNYNLIIYIFLINIIKLKVSNSINYTFMTDFNIKILIYEISAKDESSLFKNKI